MKSVMNQVHLIGNLGKDPEYFSFENGKSLCKISIATNDFYKSKDGKNKKNTEWHYVIAWGNRGENMARTLRKGHKVAISGKLSSRTYELANGKKRYVTEIIANEFKLLSKKEAALPF